MTRLTLPGGMVGDRCGRRSGALAAALLAAAAAACAGTHDAARPAAQPSAAPPSAATAARAEGRLTPAQVAAAVESAMDRSADPCVDFYQFACGTWRRNTPIPPDKSRWSRSFSAIDERNHEDLRDILEAASRDPRVEPGLATIGRYYAACMDEEAIERAGTAPLRASLDEIAAIGDLPSFMEAAGRMHRSGLAVLFRSRVQPDYKDPGTDIAYYLQAGLGMPDRDYYVKDDERSRGLRGKYAAHVARMLGLLGEPAAQAETEAADILAFETRLAQASLPREETRDPEKIYHRVERAGLEKEAPGLPWEPYFRGAGYPALTAISVGMPGYFAALSATVPATPLPTLRAYLRWHLVHGTAGTLPKAFVDEDFDFFGRTLSGQKEIEARWKRCVTATDGALGEILGRAFVERRFSGDSRPVALEMIRGIENSLKDAFPRLAWMDDATRARAGEKLSEVSNKIGYPDRWRDYSALQVSPGDYFGDARAAAAFEFRYQHDKVGGPVDRGEWRMTPPTVNAYYNANYNEMVFPAGILQPPFFHRDYPRAMNYGGIGVVMGHELTHGFDDQGRKFDGEGHLRAWWEPAATDRFKERAACVQSLYSSYEIEPGVHVNGALTLGENIGDLGGIRESFHAYRAGPAGGDPSPVEGLTSDQLFFVAFAQTWCENITPERARVLVTTDSHSPARFRVQGPVSNSPDFAQAFACAPGTPMNPKDKCEVW